MFDLERLSEVCAETGRYTFFFTSWPLNVYALVYLPHISGRLTGLFLSSLGGVASPPNAAVGASVQIFRPPLTYPL